MNNFSVAIVLIAALAGTAQAGFVHPSLISKIRNEGPQDIILELPQIIEQVENSPLLHQLTGDAKVNALVASLQSLTSRAQAPYQKLASDLGIQFESFWSSNIILLKHVDASILAAFSSLKGDFQLREQHTVSVPSVGGKPFDKVSSKRRQEVQWNVEKIRAPEAWVTTRGEGAVVGAIDTGVNIGHEAFQGNFAGAWSDPYYNSMTPDDTNGHGSHTMGVIVGQTNGIGVAPGAEWVACRGMNNQGSGTESALTHCAQFMITANPRPHLVNNAWGGGSGSGGWFNPQIAAWKAAGIVAIFGGGNSGPTCSSVGSPGDIASALQVGRTIATDDLSPGSSKGPSFEGLIKPDVVAPAVNLVSAGTGSNNYVTMSGSAAGSHVAGTVALVVSANPGISVDEIFEIVRNSAFQPPISSPDDYCGPGPEMYPNNGYGYGRVDAAEAVALARK